MVRALRMIKEFEQLVQYIWEEVGQICIQRMKVG